jgi:hypothetical protein
MNDFEKLNNKKSFPEINESFFQKQENEIIGKTIGIDNWQLEGTKTYQSYFLVPDGYWNGMEDSIRQRVFKKNKAYFWDDIFSYWPWKVAAISIFSLGLILYFFPISEPKNPNHLVPELSQISNDEIEAYLINHVGSNIEITDQIVSQALQNDKDFLFTTPTEKYIEENLSELSEEDLL